MSSNLPTVIRIATPITKPVITALDTKFTILPKPSRPSAIISTPASNDNVNTACGTSSVLKFPEVSTPDIVRAIAEVRVLIISTLPVNAAASATGAIPA